MHEHEDEFADIYSLLTLNSLTVKNNQLTRAKYISACFAQIFGCNVSNRLGSVFWKLEDNLSTAPCLVPDILVEHVRLPDLVPLPDAYCDVMGLPRGVPRYMEAGLYDAHGRKLGGLKDVVPETRVVVEFAGVSLIWGVFEHKLRGGFRGDLFFDNVPGTACRSLHFSMSGTHAPCNP